MNLLEKVRGLFSSRAQSYARVFDLQDDPLGDRRRVLDDLMKFAHFGETAYAREQRMTDVLIGRQEMLHRIFDYSKLDAEELYEKYNREKFNPRKPQE